jgi:amino acid transporter
MAGGQGGTASLDATPFTWASFTTGSVAIALLFNFASFIGFEATTIYSEEAKDPKRTVPRATYLAVLTIGAFYTVTTYLMVEGKAPTACRTTSLTCNPIRRRFCSRWVRPTSGTH